MVARESKIPALIGLGRNSKRGDEPSRGSITMIRLDLRRQDKFLMIDDQRMI